MAVIKVQTGLRLDEITWGKIYTLATRESRSMNNMVEVILKEYLSRYEEQYGEIPPEPLPDK